MPEGFYAVYFEKNVLVLTHILKVNAPNLTT